MPSTGPKYSVVWNSLPGLTPVRMPGDQRRPDESSCFGSSSHDSPSWSVVSAPSSLSWAGSMIGLITVVGSSGQPTTSDETASSSWRLNRSDVPTDPTRIARLAAEHFWPAWPNALFDRSATARSRSALGVTTMAFLPLVSASSGRSGRQERNSLAVSQPPVRMTRSTSEWETSALLMRALVDGDEAQRLARDAGLPQRLDHHGGASPAVMGRLDDDAAAGRERRQHAAGRDRDREVPRRRDDGQRHRLEARSVDDVEAERRLGVVVREVDGLADLDVGLGDRLAGLGGHHRRRGRRAARRAPHRPGAAPRTAPRRRGPPRRLRPRGSGR